MALNVAGCGTPMEQHSCWSKPSGTLTFLLTLMQQMLQLTLSKPFLLFPPPVAAHSASWLSLRSTGSQQRVKAVRRTEYRKVASKDLTFLPPDLCRATLTVSSTQLDEIKRSPVSQQRKYSIA